MKRFAFDGSKTVLKNCVTQQQENEKWNRFISVCAEFGYRVRVTGGAVLTHEINATEQDFDVLLCLM